MTAVLVIGLLMTASPAVRGTSGVVDLPADPERAARARPGQGVTGRVAAAVKTQLVEVFGQRSCSSGPSRHRPLLRPSGRS